MFCYSLCESLFKNTRFDCNIYRSSQKTRNQVWKVKKMNPFMCIKNITSKEKKLSGPDRNTTDERTKYVAIHDETLLLNI